MYAGGSSAKCGLLSPWYRQHCSVIRLNTERRQAGLSRRAKAKRVGDKMSPGVFSFSLVRYWHRLPSEVWSQSVQVWMSHRDTWSRVVIGMG